MSVEVFLWQKKASLYLGSVGYLQIVWDVCWGQYRMGWRSDLHFNQFHAFLPSHSISHKSKQFKLHGTHNHKYLDRSVSGSSCGDMHFACGHGHVWNKQSMMISALLGVHRSSSTVVLPNEWFWWLWLQDKWRNMSVSANGLGSSRERGKPLALMPPPGMLTLMDDALAIDPLATMAPADVKGDGADISSDRKSLGPR